MMRRRSLLAMTMVLLMGWPARCEKPAAPATPPAEEYRKQATRNEGNPGRGKAIFQEKRATCAQCHTVDGSAGRVGPDLYAAGDKFSRADLVRSVLEPSASIMTGYATTLVVTRKGEQVLGVVKSTTDTELVLVNAANLLQRIAKADIARQETSPDSLMPPGLHAVFTLEEFTDLIAYLETLKQPELAVANEKGTPREIVALQKPVTVVPVFSFEPPFHKPVWFGEHPTIEGAFILAEKSTAILWLLEKKDGKETRTLFVNVLNEVYVAADEGLLGVAIHPDFARNGKYYYMHEIMDGKQRGMAITERVARDDRRADSGKPARTVLRFNIDTLFHHGGGIEFGPDGYLYIGMGDGGPQEDPDGHAQDLTRLEGAISRIDVDSREGKRGYAVPPGNPFLDHKDPKVRREIFAYGLRQPWRFSFDPANGDLWVGDVGQNRFEEVTIVRAGENHGWNVFEGFELHSTRYRKDDARYIPPIVSFRRKHGVSITGGYVYRADPASSFHGVYICADYESKKLWGITQRDRKLEEIREIGQAPDRIVSFGRDRKGALYFIGYNQGVVYRLNFEGAVFE